MSKKKAERESELTSIEDGFLLDYISGKPKKASGKELVRQHSARALWHEFGISPDDMEADFAMNVDGKRKKADIAIFEIDQEHTVENLRRVVVCKPEPKAKKVSIIRTPEQAQKDLAELHAFMEEAEGCTYGMWTNKTELFFVKKHIKRFGVEFEPYGDWPMADGTLGTKDVHSEAHLRKADPEMLRNAFRRCHNFIHGNEGMPKDAAFWQFLYLIFAKMHDERNGNGKRRFFAGPTEQYDEAGRKAIRRRIEGLFKEVKAEFASIFKAGDEITLSHRALAFMVSELSKYDFTRTEVDAKGAAYQEIVGANLRGDRGQYFTPRGAIDLMIQMIDPKPNEKLLDPSCGTGGFLVSAIGYQFKRFKQEEGETKDDDTSESSRDLLMEYSKKHIFGADFDPFLVRASHMNVLMAANVDGQIFHMDSLAFPNGHLPGNDVAAKKIRLGSIDVIVTNPPFGADIPISDPDILKPYELAQKWEKL